MPRTHSQQRDDHEGEDLAQQEFVRRDARDVDLEDGFLFAFFGHGERGQQRREHRDAQDEDSGAVELLRIAAGVEPEPHFGVTGTGCDGRRPARCKRRRSRWRSPARAWRCWRRWHPPAIWTSVFVPRARSRPKCYGNDQRAARAYWCGRLRTAADRAARRLRGT